MTKAKEHKSKPVHALDLALSAWLDLYFLLGVLRRASIGKSITPACPGGGAVDNSHKFRQFLLDIYRHPDLWMGVSQFFPPRDIPPWANMFPKLETALTKWTVDGRRVYRPNLEVQAILQSTSLRDMLWQDVRLPFPTFGVELEHPLEQPVSKVKYDFLLFSLLTARMQKSPDGPVSEEPKLLLDVRWFPIHRNQYQPLSQEVKDKLLKGLKNKKWVPVAMQAGELIKCCAYLMADRFTINIEPDESISALAGRVIALQQRSGMHDQDIVAQTEMALRFTVGLSLYLQSLKPKERAQHIGAPRPLIDPGSPDPTAISSLGQVCNVSSNIRLSQEDLVYMGLAGTPEEQEALRAAMSAHWVEGHYRRRPGTGQDPEAPRIVHVGHYFTRRDRLPPGTLPGGANKG